MIDMLVLYYVAVDLSTIVIFCCCWFVIFCCRWFKYWDVIGPVLW